jgi:hypothetical protein
MDQVLVGVDHTIENEKHIPVGEVGLPLVEDLSREVNMLPVPSPIAGDCVEPEVHSSNWDSGRDPRR